jgi:IclR helix-turn-helix domain
VGNHTEGRVIGGAEARGYSSGGVAEAVLLALSDMQVEQLRRASDAGNTQALLAGLGAGRAALAARLRGPGNSRLSSSLLLGLLILASFPADMSYLGITDIARECDISMSTAHRYASTLVAAGLLERNSRSREYRLMPQASVSAPSARRTQRARKQKVPR